MTGPGSDIGISGDAQPRTMSDAAVSQLHWRIISGAIPPGSHLRLRTLAAEMDMSEMPVRDALRRLHQLGLVEIRPHRGAFVREVSNEDFVDTMETRLLLESAAVERAAARFGPQELEASTAFLDRFELLHAAGLMVEARELHRAFHFSIYSASGSRWLVRGIEPGWQNCERYRFLGQEPSLDKATPPFGHREILDACAARDVDRAGEALRHHLNRSAEAMLANIPATSVVEQEKEKSE